MARSDSYPALDDPIVRLRRRNEINNKKVKTNREARTQERKVKADRVEKPKMKRIQEVKATLVKPGKSKKPSTANIMALKSGKRSRGILEEGEIPEEDRHVPKRRSTRRLVRTSMSSPPPPIPSFTTSVPVPCHSPVASVSTAGGRSKRKREEAAPDSLEKLPESKHQKLSAPTRPEPSSDSAGTKPPVADTERTGGDEQMEESGVKLPSPKPEADSLANVGEVIQEKPQQALSPALKNGTKRKVDDDMDESRPSKARRTLGLAVPKQKKIADGIK